MTRSSIIGVLGHLVGQRRARAHDGHLAQEHVDELRELVDGVLADELADLRYARVVPHLEHGAGDLVSPLELGEALVGVFVHAAEFHMRKVDSLPSRWVWPTRIWL